mmetsp:Transcript_6732/g.24262  ORF Transcript_6732/g.24262 Transcript_6732/m.24262 type:complete len:209 (-) Transcript_6732:168-794(-)
MVSSLRWMALWYSGSDFPLSSRPSRPASRSSRKKSQMGLDSFAPLTVWYSRRHTLALAERKDSSFTTTSRPRASFHLLWAALMLGGILRPAASGASNSPSPSTTALFLFGVENSIENVEAEQSEPWLGRASHKSSTTSLPLPILFSTTKRSTWSSTVIPSRGERRALSLSHSPSKRDVTDTFFFFFFFLVSPGESAASAENRNANRRS